MSLKDVSTADAVCCGPQTTVLQAVSLMRHPRVGDLVVAEVLGNGRDAAKTTVGSLMRTPMHCSAS